MHISAEKKASYMMTGLWKRKLFFTFLIWSCISFYLYFSPQSSQFFRTIDQFIFTKMQSLLQIHHFAQTFLLLASHPNHVFIFFLIFVLHGLAFIKTQPYHIKSHKKSEFILGILCIFLTLLLVNYLLLELYIQYHKIPPKFNHPMTYMLAQFSNYIFPKSLELPFYPGYSTTAIVGIIQLSMIIYGFRKGLYLLLIGCYFLIPLIFSGLFGVSDIVFGSLGITSFFITIFFHTPIYHFSIKKISKLT